MAAAVRYATPPASSQSSSAQVPTMSEGPCPRSPSPIDEDTGASIRTIATHLVSDDVEMTAAAHLPALSTHIHVSSTSSTPHSNDSASLPPQPERRPYPGGAPQGRSHGRGSAHTTSRSPDYAHNYHHTSPRVVARRHEARHSPYPPPSMRRSRTPLSPEEEDIGSDDSSSESSVGSLDSVSSASSEKDQLRANGGFGFSVATWNSSNSTSSRGHASTHGRGRHHGYEGRPQHHPGYYSQSRQPPLVHNHHHEHAYPYPHDRRPPPPSERHPRPHSHSYRRPLSPEPLYDDYREFRDYRTRRSTLSDRSVQTSPVRVSPIPRSRSRSFIRQLTPTRLRRAREHQPGSDREGINGRERERDWEDRERQRDRPQDEFANRGPPPLPHRENESRRERDRAKEEFWPRVPSPPPSLSAPLRLRVPPPPVPPLYTSQPGQFKQHRGRTSPVPIAPRIGHTRSSMASSSGLGASSSSRHPPHSKTGAEPKHRGTRPRAYTELAPPRLIAPGPYHHQSAPSSSRGGPRSAPIREDEDYSHEDEMDEDNEDDDEYRPIPKPSGSTSATASSISRRLTTIRTQSQHPHYRADRPTKPAPLAPPPSSTATFATGPSAPTNNNGSTSTTTMFHVTTPRTLSASLAASSSGQPLSHADPEEEKMRIPSFKRAGKTRYSCVYCGLDFSRKNDAYRHMSRKHNDNATEFICVCGRVLSRGDALARHQRTCKESMRTEGKVLGLGGGKGKGKALKGKGKGKGKGKEMMNMGGEGEDGAGTEPDNDVSMEEEEED